MGAIAAPFLRSGGGRLSTLRHRRRRRRRSSFTGLSLFHSRPGVDLEAALAVQGSSQPSQTSSEPCWNLEETPHGRLLRDTPSGRVGGSCSSARRHSGAGRHSLRQENLLRYSASQQAFHYTPSRHTVAERNRDWPFSQATRGPTQPSPIGTARCLSWQRNAATFRLITCPHGLYSRDQLGRLVLRPSQRDDGGTDHGPNPQSHRYTPVLALLVLRASGSTM